MKVTVVWDSHRVPRAWEDALGKHTNPCECKDMRERCPATFAETFEVDAAQPSNLYLALRLGDHIVDYPAINIVALDFEDPWGADAWRRSERLGRQATEKDFEAGEQEMRGPQGPEAH